MTRVLLADGRVLEVDEDRVPGILRLTNGTARVLDAPPETAGRPTLTLVVDGR